MAASGLADVDDLKANLLVPWYLMASFLYYHHDLSILTDSQFDRICVRLLSRWRVITHRHKHLIDKESLAAGTGYDIRVERLPLICQSSAWAVARKLGLVKEEAAPSPVRQVRRRTR